MPCTAEAVDVLRKANVLVAPSMAAGVGGVGSTFLTSLFMISNSLVENSKHYLNLHRKSLCISTIFFALVQSKLMLLCDGNTGLGLPIWVRYNAKVGNFKLLFRLVDGLY